MPDKEAKTFINPPLKKRGIFYLFRLLCILILILCGPQLIAQARLKVVDAKLNFGMVKRGTLITNKYVIKNTGAAPLIIQAVDISCSCTTASFPNQPLMPGKSDTIFVMFNTATVYGRQDREVFVRSNNADGPVKLRYKGIVLNR